MSKIGAKAQNYKDKYVAYKESLKTTTCNCTSTCCGTTISNIFQFGALAVGLGGAVNTVGNTVNNIFASSQAKKEQESGSASSINSVFTYGNDYQTDYAEGAVKAIEKDIAKIEEDIAAKNKSIKDLKINDLNTKVEDAGKAVTDKAKALNDAKAAYDTANNVQGEGRNEAEVNSLKHAWDTAKAEHDKALDAQTKAQKALDDAKAKEKTYNDEIDKLGQTKEELETKRIEYKTLDDANGNKSNERIKSKKANDEDSIQNETFEIRNARQLINEFASARRAYESNKTPENKAILEKAKANFMSEYEKSEGDTEHSADRNSVAEAYKIISKYEIK